MVNISNTAHAQPKEEYVSLLSSRKQQPSRLSQRQSNRANNHHKTTGTASSVATTTITISHRTYSSVAIISFVVIAIFCTFTIYNTLTNYEFATKLEKILSSSTNNLQLPRNPESRSTSAISLKTQQHEQTVPDDTAASDDDEHHSRSGSSRLGSMLNRFRFHNDNAIANEKINSNAAVMQYNSKDSENKQKQQFRNSDGDIIGVGVGENGPTNEETNVVYSEDRDDKLADGEERQPNSSNDSDDETLFQEEITKNFNASLYRSYHEFSTRSQRFPSVAERVKVYMSNWYLPPILPCNSEDSGDNDPRIQYKYQIETNPLTNETHAIVLLRQSSQSPVTNMFQNENYNNSLLLQLNMIPTRTRTPFIYNHTYIVQASADHFLQDAYKHYIPSLGRLQYPDTSDIAVLDMLPQPPIPIILQQGDAEQYRMYSPTIDSDIYRPYVPVIKKFRYSMSAHELQRVTTATRSMCDEASTKPTIEAIEQPSRVSRTIRIAEPFMKEYDHDRSTIPQHVQPIISILSNYERHFNPLNDVIAVDRPWNTKKNIAIYRGALTGKNRVTTPSRNSDIDEEMKDVMYCDEIPRCRLVLNHGHSQYVDAKLVASRTKDDGVKAMIRNVSIFGESMNFQQMLEYKAIIMLEGNDVSTGLKWSLYSNSVVLTPKPTCTSWAMEELLVPYVHYIPLYDNLTNVEEQVRWMIEHDKEAEQIAYNGILWMMDLVYHTDVKRDTEEIIDETFRRYMKHFRYNPHLQ